MIRRSRQQYFGILTSLFFVLFGEVGTIHLALRDNAAPRLLLKQSTLPELSVQPRESVVTQKLVNHPTPKQSNERENAAIGFKPRLPPHYSQLVTPQQRERIYGIQKRYYVELEKLRLTIAKYEAERDKLIHACLTSDQQRRLMQFQGGANE